MKNKGSIFLKVAAVISVFASSSILVLIILIMLGIVSQ